MYVYSEHVHFSEFNPDENEEITVFTEFHYWASRSTLDAENVPVNFYATRPGSPKELIGSTVITTLTAGVPDYGARYVFMNWRNRLSGVHIIEAEVDPSYEEANTRNNAATRAVIVGEVDENSGVLDGQVIGPEGGVEHATIELHDGYGMYSHTTTGDNGYYLFESLPVGEYIVNCVVAEPYLCDTTSRVVEIVDQQVTTANFYLYENSTPPEPNLDLLPPLTGQCSVAVTELPTATDNCDGIVNGVTSNQLSYNVPGNYVITWTYTDANGNSASQEQSVVVTEVPQKCVEGLTARAKISKVQLVWVHNGSREYQIYRSTTGADEGFELLATTTSTYSTFLDEGLTVGQGYWYYVTGTGSCPSEVVRSVPTGRSRSR